ncbi:tRNA (N(6)-L-threonylcarbamoyladenosine(37)-C(2))-methylthiotransferase MtaB [Flammeovirga pacifica]|uniref:Threonylcarbamoyladenosine tRNA methylthiotransferase MtaB n=1 Tax=Flammeovirga pacifica TaxID=915059 RepID=A0A1S1YWC3_FLAPC|nr:tRNA (N(6)-L-threonylcarbamoyladenosine(37)-C(2))-methylthiotransferase MtaB [Flammeovirga pacifica]OHX65332.1 tRNA (N(6)-L-threonylcarbamoyladenosine(37)-C(2))-methylthiotransferase MtaB [Flammeovirga pacifica]
MRKVAFYTLGCKLNFSETSTIGRQFEEKGYKKVEFADTPDIYIINTCSVTDNADKKCQKIVREAKKISPNSYVAIIGCYAQLKPKEISELEGVDAVLGAAEKFRLLDLLDGFVKTEEPQVLAKEIKETKEFVSGYSMNDRTRTFLKVQDGCNYKCSFCTIPLARGKSRSASIDDIIKNAKEIAASDVKEVVLTGVNIGDFGIIDGKRQERLIDLLKELDKVEGIERYRISSIEPNLLDEEIIQFCTQSDKFVPHFHIPLQSGSDKMLELMRRRYRTDLYQSRITEIRSQMPDACIGVDVIIGFPGETEEDFLDTYNFLNELDVAYLHVFTYSERPNTDAVHMDGVVPKAERAKRSKMLRILSDKKKRAFYETQLGTTRTVLFEHDIEEGKMFGFTENYVRVEAKYDPALVNELKTIELVQVNDENIVEIKEPEIIYEKH